MPRPASPCALRAYVAFYVTFEPALRYSPRKQQFELVLLGELSWQGGRNGSRRVASGDVHQALSIAPSGSRGLSATKMQHSLDDPAVNALSPIERWRCGHR